MATLYELSASYSALLELYDSAEDKETRKKYLEMLLSDEEALSNKADIYARIMRNKQTEAEALKAEADRLTAKRKAAEAVIERLKDALLGAMMMAHTDAIQTTIGKWRLQMNPYSCEVTDADAVPVEFHTPQPDVIERGEILKRFKETGEIPTGVNISQTMGIRFR